MATEQAPTHVVRYGRGARLFHMAGYVVTLALLGTGWWLWAGREGRPSVAAQLLDTPDVELHRTAGWLLAGLAVVPVTLGLRATVTFARETARVDRGDGRWLVGWARGAVTGRFAAHRGHFDPGQRLANAAFAIAFVAVVVSGVGLTTVHGGDAFVWWGRVHRLATYALTCLVVGHLILASGLLPGYRGAWRSMHGRGRVPTATGERLWPAATARAVADQERSADQVAVRWRHPLRSVRE